MINALLVATLAAAITSVDDPELGVGAKSLAPWTQAGSKDLGELSEAARDLRASIVLVGSPKVGTGTAFVISKANRLLATNAHVADIMAKAGGEMLAIVEGVDATYKVDAVYYHPGVLRQPPVDGSGRLLVRSDDAMIGAVHPFCPDMAVLRLAREGPDLPAEVTLADWAEVKDLFARPIGIVGFPGYNNKGWPEQGHRVASTYQTGMISRATDFKLDADRPVEELQFLQHSAPAWFGFSGSPIFLANGHVVAIHNSVRNSQEQGLSATNSQGVRVDGLRELLLYHKLDDLVAAKAGDPVPNLESFTKPDPDRDDLVKAIRLAAESRKLTLAGTPATALERAEEAVKLSPGFAIAYQRRAEARWALCETEPSRVSPNQKLALLELALKDMVEASKQAPSPPTLIDLIGLRNYLFATINKPEGYRENLVALDKLLGNPSLLPEDRGRAFQARAAARLGLGDKNAIADINRAVELAPNDPDILEDRAQMLRALGEPALANQDLERARAVRQKIAAPR